MKKHLFAYFLFLALTILHPVLSCAQDAASTNCGVNSALSIARVLGSSVDARVELQTKYPSATVSLLDVKQMCQQIGVKTSGAKATLNELLENGTPCIIGLKNPEHFTVLLDGTRDEVRILDGDEGALQVTPRREIETRFTGFALVPELAIDGNAPRLQMSAFDQYLAFSGIGQQVAYRFALKNEGKSPLSVEVAGTSCGCTAALLKGADAKNIVLAPGQSSEVVVSYQVQTQAAIQQTVTLKTNDPRRREVYLSVRGQLPPQLTLSPPALYVEQNKGEEPNKRFKVIGPQGTEVARVWSDLPYLQFKVTDKQQDGERIVWPVEVRGFAQAPAGSINGKVLIRLKDGAEMFVAVRGTIEGAQLPGASEAALLPRAEDNPTDMIAVAIPQVEVGKPAPDFAVADINGKVWKLSDLKGNKNLLLTFFPKCFTGGCANHLSSLRDHQKEFDDLDTQVLAVSVDPAEGEKGQRAFAAQWQLKFPLIPDEKRGLSKLFGAAQNEKQLSARMSVLIDKTGIVRLIDTNVQVATHGTDVLAKMKDLGITR